MFSSFRRLRSSRATSGWVWLLPLLGPLWLTAEAQNLSRLPQPRWVLQLSEEYNTNLYFDKSANAIGDSLFQAIPELQLDFGNGSLSTGRLDLQEQISFHSHEHGLNRHLFDAVGSGQHEFAQGVLGATASYVQSSQTSSVNAGVIDSTNWNTGLTYSGQLGLKMSLTTRLSAGGTRYSTATSSNPLTGQNYTNQTNQAANVDLGRNLTPKLQAGAGVGEAWDHYASLSGRTDSLYLFLRDSISAKSELTLQVGINHRKIPTGAGGTFPGVDLTWNHELTEKTHETLTLSNSALADAYGNETRLWALNYKVNVKLRHYLFFDANLGANSSQYVPSSTPGYSSYSGRLNYLSFDTGLSYRLRYWCTLGASVHSQFVRGTLTSAYGPNPRNANQEIFRLSVNLTY